MYPCFITTWTCKKKWRNQPCAGRITLLVLTAPWRFRQPGTATMRAQTGRASPTETQTATSTRVPVDPGPPTPGGIHATGKSMQAGQGPRPDGRTNTSPHRSGYRLLTTPKRCRFTFRQSGPPNGESAWLPVHSERCGLLIAPCRSRCRVLSLLRAPLATLRMPVFGPLSRVFPGLASAIRCANLDLYLSAQCKL